MWSERGKEFYNQTFLNFLKQNEIQTYSTNSDLKECLLNDPKEHNRT